MRLDAVQDLRALEGEHGDATEDRCATKQRRVAHFRMQALESRVEGDQGDAQDLRAQVRRADQAAGRHKHRAQLEQKTHDRLLSELAGEEREDCHA